MNIEQSKYFLKDDNLEKLLRKLESYKHPSKFVLESEMDRIKSAHSGYRSNGGSLEVDGDNFILPGDDPLINLISRFLNDKSIPSYNRRDVMIYLYNRGFITQYYDYLELPGDILTKDKLPLRDAIKLDIDDCHSQLAKEMRILDKEFPGFDSRMVNSLKMLNSDIEVIRTAIRNYTNDAALQKKLEDRIMIIREKNRSHFVTNNLRTFIAKYNVCPWQTYSTNVSKSLIVLRKIVPSDKHAIVQTNYYCALKRS